MRAGKFALLAVLTVCSAQQAAAQCPVPAATGYQPYPTELALNFDQAARNGLGIAGPVLQSIDSGYPTSVKVSPFIPKSLIKAVGWTETTNWKQFNASYGQYPCRRSSLRTAATG